MNPGGNDQLAFDFAGRFATSTTTSGFVQFRNGPGHSDFTPRQARTFSPRGSFQFTRPVRLLIGRFCASSNESFIAAMQQLPQVILVGDTTGGATANPQTFALGGGWSYTVSRWIEYTASGQVIEDQGIAPSVAVPVSAGDFQSGRDPVLDSAIASAALQVTSQTATLADAHVYPSAAVHQRRHRPETIGRRIHCFASIFLASNPDRRREFRRRLP
jgi:C-terminal processing protease CtpA/Prc